jgi:hypothetical protein
MTNSRREMPMGGGRPRTPIRSGDDEEARFMRRGASDCEPPGCLDWVGCASSIPWPADTRSILDAGLHRKAMNDRFGELVTRIGRRAMTAALCQEPIEIRSSTPQSGRRTSASRLPPLTTDTARPAPFAGAGSFLEPLVLVAVGLVGAQNPLHRIDASMSELAAPPGTHLVIDSYLPNTVFSNSVVRAPGLVRMLFSSCPTM